MPKHVARKLTTEEDVWGNSAADDLTGKTAARKTVIECTRESDEIRLVPLTQQTHNEESRSEGGVGRPNSCPEKCSKMRPGRRTWNECIQGPVG